MIEPAQKDDALLADIHEAAPGRGFCVWWLGQSGFLVKSTSHGTLFDPYLSDSLTEKYANTQKPHVRMTQRVVGPGKLEMVDVLTSSHHHSDHLDNQTLPALFEANPQARLVLPAAHRDFAAERLGLSEGEADRRLHTLDAGQSIDTGGVRMTGITAAHNEIERDPRGRHKFLGFVAQVDGSCIYHSGDTLMHEGLVEQLEAFKIDLALLPINGNRPERQVPGNLFGDEAAQLAKRIGARSVIPCHYDMFEFNTEPTDLFERTCREIDQPYTIPRCGERIDFRQE